MKSASALIAASALALLSACAAPAPGSGAQSPAPVQWKEVTRLEGGNFVTYRVPVTQKVNDDVNVSGFDSAPKPVQTAKTSAASAGEAHVAGAPSHSIQDPPKIGTGLIVAPLFRQAPKATDRARVADGASAPSPQSDAASYNISQDAEVALGRAEIVVREAQSRFETALAALKRARAAAHNGDSEAVVKFSGTAMTLAQPGR